MKEQSVNSTDCLDIFTSATSEWFRENLGNPTEVQKAAWKPIANGKDVLVSAPTGTGKTLTAFLVFIDKLKKMAALNCLEKELFLIYISPLKSLAGDIRENLKKPLDGISAIEGGFAENIKVSVRTGDTTQNERRVMFKKPPQILITTPESLYLLLSGTSGLKLLSTAQAIILDELHAMIDSKRGAHLMLSLARLDKLCGKPLQRIGLSATVEPLSRAAQYLSPREVVIAAPEMKKSTEIRIVSPFESGDGETTLWDNLSRTVYNHCRGKRSVIAFLEGRAYAEKLAFYVNKLGGEGFARTHHGCLSKEQRFEVENMLRSGELRLLCATSSMELGIDVGDIDEVFQIGCPATVAGTMQRLGRAGHNPGRTSVMYMFPRTSWEGLFCAMTAEVARNRRIEPVKPPSGCLDILAQHLVSMTVGGGYTVDDVLALLPLAYPFRDITRDDVCAVLEMLAGDYEHGADIPVRPRLLYDRIHGQVEGDAYSRMLAVSAGGTIPDRGMYAAKTENGARVGELDEEFVFESRVGDKFQLGTFSWQIVDIKKDTVTVKQTASGGARIPFWHNEWRGRGIETGLRFGALFRKLNEAHCADKDLLMVELYNLGLDELSAKSADNFLKRQFASTGILPDDRTIVVEHFTDDSDNHQVMFHSIFGRQVNAPLSALVHDAAQRITGLAIGCVDMDDGFLLFPFGGEPLPKSLLSAVDLDTARERLAAMLPSLPMFSIVFRYNIARALLTGLRKMGRTPLWLQRTRSAQMLDSVIGYKNHPIVRETKREILDDLWDIGGTERVLEGITSGAIRVVETVHDTASPLSLPCRWQVEAAVMYDYTPVTGKVSGEIARELSSMIEPSREQLAVAGERTKQPRNEKELHTLLMIEGDLEAGDLAVSSETLIAWLENLAAAGRAVYAEPGLWIAAEQSEAYTDAFSGDETALQNIIRRMLRYRGAKTAEKIADRYFLPERTVSDMLATLTAQGSVTENDGIYYHTELYDRARNATVRKRREVKTLPPENYAAFLANRTRTAGTASEQLEYALDILCGTEFPVKMWETVLLPSRVDNYNSSMLDAKLAEGKYYWQLTGGTDGNLIFYRTEDIDWDNAPEADETSLNGAELAIFDALKKRGASFVQSLSRLIGSTPPHEPLLSLTEKGLVCADNFQPVRYLLQKESIENAALKRRIAARTSILGGRWDIVRPQFECDTGQLLRRAFAQNGIIARETPNGISWSEALETLRVWEYTGQARRGYFIDGLSGAQFIEAGEFAALTLALGNPCPDIIWLPAHDPAQIWGKTLSHYADRQFMNIAGSVAALRGGLPIAVFERQGKVLRVFDYEHLEEALKCFKSDFVKRRVFNTRNSITVSSYPDKAEQALKKAGFSCQMLDYVLYNTN